MTPYAAPGTPPPAQGCPAPKPALSPHSGHPARDLGPFQPIMPIKTLPMPPYFYQTPDWMKPRSSFTVYSVGQAIQIKELGKP